MEPPPTATFPQWPPTATSVQWPFFLADSPYTESCFNLSTTATSLQRLFVLADSDCPYIHSCFNLFTTVTSLQWPLSSVPKVTVVDERSSTVLGNNSLLSESNDPAHVFFFLLLEIVEPQRKKKKRKKGKAEQGTEAGEICDKTFHLSPYIITECEVLCSVKMEGQFV